MTQVEKGYSHILGATCQPINTWAGPKLQQFALPCSWDQHPIQPSWPISARSRGHQYQFPLHLWTTQSLPAETQNGKEIIYTTQSSMDQRQGSLIPWYGQIDRGRGRTSNNGWGTNQGTLFGNWKPITDRIIFSPSFNSILNKLYCLDKNHFYKLNASQ